MRGSRPGRRTSLVTLALLWSGTLGIAEHLAQSPPPNAVGQEVSDVGHAGPDRSLHLDPAVVQAPHACVVCWLGSAGAAMPALPPAMDGTVSAQRAVPPAPEPRSAVPAASAPRGPPVA
jgi:hypothetical protein